MNCLLGQTFTCFSQSQAWHPSVLYFIILQLGVCKLQSLNFLAHCLLVVFCQWETLLGGWKVRWGDGSLYGCFCFCHHPPIRAAIYGPVVFQHTRHQPHGAISGVPATATQRLLLCMLWLVTLPSPVCSPSSSSDSYFLHLPIFRLFQFTLFASSPLAPMYLFPCIKFPV